MLCIAVLRGGRLATGHFTRGASLIRLWRLSAAAGSASASASAEAAGTLRGHRYAVTTLAAVKLAPSDKRAGSAGAGAGAGAGGEPFWLLASGSDDQTVRLWDVDAAEDAEPCRGVLTGHCSAVVTLADMGGGRLLSGAADGALRVWCTAAQRCLAVVPAVHSAKVRPSARFSVLLHDLTACAHCKGSRQELLHSSATCIRCRTGTSCG